MFQIKRWDLQSNEEDIVFTYPTYDEAVANCELLAAKLAEVGGYTIVQNGNKWLATAISNRNSSYAFSIMPVIEE